MNTNQVEGKFDQVAGKIKQGIGEAVGNQKLANSGAADQVKGAAKETWGNAKDAAGTVHDNIADRTTTEPVYRTEPGAGTVPAEDSADHNVRESVVGMANKVRDSIDRGLDNIKEKSRS